MSLDSSDLMAIRQIVREEVQQQLEPLESKVEAQGNDIKDIYNILIYNGLEIMPS